MEYKWLFKNNSEKLIVFFNGWGMDENVVAHLNPCGFDVLMLYDYNSLGVNIDISDYKYKHILAWSMGVMVASAEETNCITSGAKSVTAISGTPFPINDEYGIPKRIYNLTVRGFSQSSCEKFIERMGVSSDGKAVTERKFENQKSELVSLLNYSCNPDFKYTGAIIPDSDLIIPSKNQLNYWNTQKGIKTVIVHSAHCPFLLYNKWTELIL